MLVERGLTLADALDSLLPGFLDRFFLFFVASYHDNDLGAHKGQYANKDSKDSESAYHAVELLGSNGELFRNVFALVVGGVLGVGLLSAVAVATGAVLIVISECIVPIVLVCRVSIVAVVVVIRAVICVLSLLVDKTKTLVD